MLLHNRHYKNKANEGTKEVEENQQAEQEEKKGE